MIDLHVHSTCSDGTLTPRELMDYAIEKGLSAFALTDHDTTAGLKELQEYERVLRQGMCSRELTHNAPTGKSQDTLKIPRVIPGIELSSEYNGRDIHIVGLFIDEDNPEFKAYLEHFISSREERNERMCALLSTAGIDIHYEDLKEMFPGAVITRAHYAKYMLEKGYIKSIKEAFERYVGDHCPYFVPREKVTPMEAVALIKMAGGIPILAHPILYRMSDKNLEILAASLKEYGLVGIEAIYSTYAPSEERDIRRLATKLDLRLSGGSDFHGSNKPDIDLGTGRGKLYVPDEILTKLEEARKTS